MRKVLVVDDEKWIRRGLIQSLGWSEFGLELAGEAENGEDAYELALKLKPELLFLDMRMPGMDGKQLLGLLSQALPGLLVIVISGYSDFEYTKEAIRHKAFDYLLKPVRKEELNAVLSKAVAELERRELQRREAARHRDGGWLRQLLAGHPEAEGAGMKAGAAAVLPPGWAPRGLRVLIGQPDIYPEQPDSARLMEAVREQLDRLQPLLFGGSWAYEAAFLDGGRRELLLALSGEQLAQRDMERVCTTLQTVFKLAGCTSASIGISAAQPGAARLREATGEAAQALRCRLLGQKGAVLAAGVNAGQAGPRPVYPAEQERELLLALQSGSCAAAVQAFTRFLDNITAETATVETLQRSSLQLLVAMEKQLQSRGADFGRIAGKSPSVYTEMLGLRNDRASVAKLFAEELIPAVADFYHLLGEKPTGKVVEEMKQQVEAYYNQALSLQGIAQSYYMNPDYLSRVFKKATGKNFVDYLTDVRIGKSKELLKVCKYKNYEIAQMVGYEDYRYFSQIFKKRQGMTIGEYRNACCQADR